MFCRRPEPGRRARRTRGSCARRWRSSTGSSCATCSRSRRRRSGTTRPRSSPARSRAQDIGTEVFFLPAAAHTEKDGTFTNTQRLLQWHHKAVEPPGDCRSELHWIYHLGQRIREKLAGSTRPEGPADPRADVGLPARRARTDEPDAEHVLQEISGRNADGSFVPKYQELKDDGSTTCGSWIHCGIYADGVNQAARKTPHSEQNWVAPRVGRGRGRRTRASSTTAPRPTRRAGRGRSASATSGGTPSRAEWTGVGDTPTSRPTRRPTTPRRGRQGRWRRSPATSRSSPHPDGLGWLYVAGRARRRPAADALRAAGVAVREPALRPAAEPDAPDLPPPENPYHPSDGEPGAEVFPFVLTTYRLTEHHTAGGMSRTVPYLAELQPEFFCEVSRSSPPSAASSTAAGRRSSPRARPSRRACMVTDADQAAAASKAGRCTWSARPITGAASGIVTGDSANELLPLALDNNVHISEYKAATCDIRPGRRPRGPARARARRGLPPAGGGEGSMKLETHAWPASLRRATPSRGWASSPTRRCASAARRARSRARSGTRSR